MAPTPEEIYARTKEEGKRRLERPFLEEMSTALAAGFDIVAGLAVYALLQSHLQHLLGRDAAHVVASVGFGFSFVFLVTGRGELFTENFLVPLAGVDEDEPHTWRKLLKLWLTSAPCNIVAGLVIVLLLTVHSVLPYGSGAAYSAAGERSSDHGGRLAAIGGSNGPRTGSSRLPTRPTGSRSRRGTP